MKTLRARIGRAPTQVADLASSGLDRDTALVKRLLPALAVALGVFGTAIVGLFLSRGTGALSIVWAADAVQMTALMRSERRHWALYLAVGFIAGSSADLIMGATPAIGFGLSACNTFGLLPAAWLLRRVCGGVPDLSRRDHLIAYGLVACAGMSALSAVPASLLLHFLVGATLGQTWQSWFLSDALGMVTVGPALTAILPLRFADMLPVLRDGRRRRTAAIMVLVLVAAFAIFHQSEDMLLPLVFPLVLIATFDRGFAGAAIAVFLVSAVAVPITVAGYGPFSDAYAPVDRVVALQFFLTITAATALPMAIVLAERERLQEGLLKSMEDANRANAAKSAFMASMSHEFRTPLNAVIGFAEVLLNERAQVTSEQRRDYVGLILKAGRQLLALVTDTLDFTEIEAGRVRFVPDEVTIPDLLDDAVALMMPIARDRNVTLAIEGVPEQIPAVRADRRRLLQILTNLLSNAIKYNQPAGRVTVSAVLADPRWVRISVQDTGIGIPIERQAEVFEPFNRLGAEARTIEGTGIGLTICRRLVVRMGGRIGFESRVGEGSRFWVVLPAAEPPPAEEARLDDEPIKERV